MPKHNYQTEIEALALLTDSDRNEKRAIKLARERFTEHHSVFLEALIEEIHWQMTKT